MSKRRRWFRSLPVLLLIGVLHTRAHSQTSSIDIKSAIDMALANNYSLKADSLNNQIANHRTRIARADLLPQINFNSKAEYNPALPSQMLPGNFVGQPDKDLIPVQFGTRYSMGSSIEATQTIIRKTTRLQVEAAELNTGIAQTRHLLSREELVYQVATAYYDLLATTEKISTTNKDYANIREIEVIAKAQYESGVLKRIDFESLQINAANIQSQLNQSQTKYNQQLVFFKYLLGLPANASITIANDLTRIPASVQGGGTKLWNREDVHLYRQLIASKELELKTIKAEKLPSLSAFFRFNYQSQFNQPSDAMKGDYGYKSSTVGITTSIPLFDGNRRKNRLNLAQVELQQLQFRNEQQQQLATTEWITASETLHNNLQQVQITQQNLVLAEKVFASRKALYTEGVTTLIELLDAERELSQSRNLHTQAVINVQTSLVDAHKANGTLLTEFLKSL
ncbi:TolC family protein [Niastella caeni]|uniref:TolC family protein n=1 Tax=Niastella caeni TaxID=2569763 RepID=A0A4S8HDR4_9BACT|nr:TolC family protein [Niastella caeni]THU31544.1 TolC family protein [Niastella caeni]